MPSYTPPLRDIFFSLNEVNDFAAHYAKLDISGEFGVDDLNTVLPEIGRFAADILAPLNSVGDQEGIHCERGEVTSPSGFAEAYQQYYEGGWPALAQAEEYGGLPAPFSVKLAASEFLQSANQSWCMYTALNDGAIKCLSSFASQTLIDQYVPKLVSGEWLGTMCLTEPQCGSDLNLLKSKAEPTDRGNYLISGTKIFISSGEHDFTSNIVHLVLAKLPDSPEGTRGISLFVVPKYKLNADGSVGEKNALSCVSVERKMGLKGSATCVMAFDGAEGWLVGEANRGLQNMFVFINKSRLGVGQQAQGQIEAAHQAALAYARERLAGRAPTGAVNAEGEADPLIYQADIQRMLMVQKAVAEAGRGLIHLCGKYVDLTDYGNAEQRQQAEAYLNLLIPITKGCLSELASELCDYSVQILGGHGYVSEWEVEQRVRDVRVTRIYEGTTGIQGADLLGRKVLGRNRTTFDQYCQDILAECQRQLPDNLQAYQHQLAEVVGQWRAITDTLASEVSTDARLLGAVAVDYLMIAGYISLGYVMLLSGGVAQAQLDAGSDENDFYLAKLQTVSFYFDRVMPRIRSHVGLIASGTAGLDCELALGI